MDAGQEEPWSAGLNKLFPHWDHLRGDPRFEELARRVGI